MAENSSHESSTRKEIEESRRQFMKAAGKLAVYTPPAMVLLMRPAPDAIAGSPGGSGNGLPPPD